MSLTRNMALAMNRLQVVLDNAQLRGALRLGEDVIVFLQVRANGDVAVCSGERKTMRAALVADRILDETDPFLASLEEAPPAGLSWVVVDSGRDVTTLLVAAPQLLAKARPN